MDKKGLEASFGELLVAEGFRKKGSTWYRQVEGALQVVDLQKSNYGAQFFVNLCCVPAGMVVEGLPNPKEHKCPIRIRLTAAFPDDRKSIESVLDLDISGLADSERTERLRGVVRHKILPFVAHMQSATTLRAAITAGVFDGGAVNLAARRHMGLH